MNIKELVEVLDRHLKANGLSCVVTRTRKDILLGEDVRILAETVKGRPEFTVYLLADEADLLKLRTDDFQLACREAIRLLLIREVERCRR